jgi:hypothetical protein
LFLTFLPAYSGAALRAASGSSSIPAIVLRSRPGFAFGYAEASASSYKQSLLLSTFGIFCNGLCRTLAIYIFIWCRIRVVNSRQLLYLLRFAVMVQNKTLGISE